MRDKKVVEESTHPRTYSSFLPQSEVTDTGQNNLVTSNSQKDLGQLHNLF